MYDASDAEDASAFHAESTPRYRAALPSQSEGTPDSLDDREALAADRIGSRDRRDARRLDDIGAGWQASALHFGAHPAPSSVNEGIANALCCSTLRRGLHLLAADTGDVSAALPENTRSRLAALDFASALRLETGDVAKGDPQGRWRLSEWMDVERYKTLGIDCLLFDVAGQSTRCRYPRQELLRDLQRGAGQATQYPYVQSSDDAFIRNSVPVIADDTASPARCRSAFAQAVRHGTPPSAVGMPKMRDLRLVDPAFQAEPALVVREGVIFVVLDDQLRSVIQSDRVLVFAPDSVPTKHARAVLAERLAAAADSWYAPFEFVVLEALLVAGSDLLEAEVSRLERRIDLSLATLRRRITKERAEQLRLLKARLLRLAQRCRTFRDALTRALDDEQTLRHMYLSEMRHAIGARRALHDDEEVELLLENYLQIAQNQVSRTELLERRIRIAQDIYELQLAAAQNRLWSFSIVVRLAFVALLIMAVPTDYIGMSLWLPIFNELHFYWPWYVMTSLTIAASVIGVAVTLRQWSARGLLFGLFSQGDSET
ncbi:hypothetical protein CDCA_CDCA09G2751 [Cyanidium caldarium]|uniref:Magnesium transporter n=1 Tax=Cyanidium caldarium TaxID=2771 RepID=A0AAV9IXB8_CYACA|nr:hypothetical protein CDCA_CDCA09G2751 [Cyanidium caldarium]